MATILKRNNFDFLRLMLAMFVIITHSYPLSGIPENDILSQWSDQQASLSNIGVRGFFVISGYLIFQSLERSSSLLNYYWKRFLRLYPGLLLVLILTVLLAPFVYHNESRSYLRNIDVYKYIPYNISLYRLKYTIAGVFDNNPHTNAINGSLWTLCYEFTCYLLLSVLFFIRNQKLLIRVLLAALFILLYIANIFYPNQLDGHIQFHDIHSKYLFTLGIYFTAGSLLASLGWIKEKKLGLLAGISLAGIAISMMLHYYQYTSYFLLPLLMISFGKMSTPYLNQIGEKVGDLSYGVYIYGYPVQQTLVYFFHFNYMELMITSIPVVLFFAFISWHLVEKRALRLKKISMGSFNFFSRKS